MINKNRFFTAMLLVNALSFSQISSANTVAGSYTGIVDSDSGLGLLGQTMQVDFSYDDSVSPDFTFGNGGSSFSNFLENMVVTIGSHSWSWDKVNGYSSISLDDDNLILINNGVEDRISMFADNFNGPNLPAEPVSASSYSFALHLYDYVPVGNPDGLTVETELPAQAPNPDLFDADPMNNTMRFSFVAGDLEIGNYYSITTANVAVSSVPIPPAVWLFASSLLGLCSMSRRHRQVLSA